MDVKIKQRHLLANIGKTKTGAEEASTLPGSKIIAQRRVHIVFHEKVFLSIN